MVTADIHTTTPLSPIGVSCTGDGECVGNSCPDWTHATWFSHRCPPRSNTVHVNPNAERHAPRSKIRSRIGSMSKLSGIFIRARLLDYSVRRFLLCNVCWFPTHVAPLCNRLLCRLHENKTTNHLEAGVVPLDKIPKRLSE